MGPDLVGPEDSAFLAALRQCLPSSLLVLPWKLGLDLSLQLYQASLVLLSGLLGSGFSSLAQHHQSLRMKHCTIAAATGAGAEGSTVVSTLTSLYPHGDD